MKIFKIEFPNKIEALDISNLFLEDSASSFSCFINGEYVNTKFQELKEPEKSDFEYMKKACEIHYKSFSQDEMPVLIVVDGGKEQIKSVKLALENLNLKSRVIGLVKNKKHQTEKMMNENLEEINFENKEIKNFFTEMQKIMHDKAIKIHRKIHIKKTISSEF